MNKNILKKIIVENQERIQQLKVYERNIDLEKKANYIFIGQRRAGKTFLIYNQMQKMLDNGIEKEKLLYINFEDERLIELKADELDMIIESYKELFALQPILFFDEIQNIENWQFFARRLADNGFKTYLTGSNAKMLSKDMASTLGGRFLIKEVPTLSFNEFIHFNGVQIKKNMLYSSQRFEIRKLFEEYFYNGGFPELSKYQDKKEYLSTIFQKIFLGDIIARNKIRNTYALHLMVKKLAESVMDEVSFNRIKNIINSTGVNVGTATLIEYLGYLEDAFLVKSIHNYKQKITRRETKKKFYFKDHGLLGLFLNTPESFLLENIVFSHLQKKFKDEVYYVRTLYEIDFYIPEKLAVQVSYDLKQDSTRQREVFGLLTASKEVSFSRAIIITLDEEFTIKENELEIKVKPVWKWLLEDDSVG